MNTFYLAAQHLRFHRVRATLLVLALGLTAFMPLAVHGLLARYGDALTRRAAATPLVLGTAGHRFDRVFNALYFRAAELDPVPYSEVDAVLASGLALPVPLHARFTARDHPVVGTTPEYYALRGLRAAAGTPPLRLGEATLGARAAAALDLRPGDRVPTDQRDLYDLTASYPLSLEVVGVFAPTGTPDDDAVFVDLKTTWTIAGIGHGHAAPERSGAMDPGLATAQVVNDENRASFHAHGDPATFPLTAIIVVPPDDKSATLLKARTNARPGLRMISPAAVVDELLGIVLKIKRFFDAHQAITGFATLLFVGLIIGLSARMRRDELWTLAQLGASRGFALRLQAAEWLLMGVAATALALLGVLALALALPDGVLP
ncbi:MAG: hypothetical protein H6706_20460 [Myxococcales bacterium]|nr:hypothetical protein [Myxococcales bacterium]